MSWIKSFVCWLQAKNYRKNTETMHLQGIGQDFVNAIFVRIGFWYIIIWMISWYSHYLVQEVTVIYLIKKQDCIIEIHNNHVQKTVHGYFFVSKNFLQKNNKNLLTV